MKSLMLIDIDVILDTRVGTLFEINPVEAMAILDRGFRERTSDDLTPFSDRISTEQYQEAYDNRTKYTLSQSRPTRILQVLAPQLLKVLINTTKENARLEDCCLVVNTYPYQFSDEEAKAIQRAISHQVGENFPIRLASLLPESTRLSNLQMREYTDYITYDIQGWIEREFGHITDSSEFISVPNISIWGPQLAMTADAHRLVIESEPDLSELDDPWEFLKVTFAPFVNLNWIPVTDVSLIS